MSKHVRIENPVSGGVEYTSVNRARRYVKQGRAAWIAQDRALRFLSQAEMDKSAAAHAATVQRAAMLTIKRDVTTQRYDIAVQSIRLRRREAKHLPFAGDIRKMDLA